MPLLKLAAWPSAEDLELDDSQYKALQMALTKEFAVIQGPPGTVKTYIGLKVKRKQTNKQKTTNNNSSARTTRVQEKLESRLIDHLLVLVFSRLLLSPEKKAYQSTSTLSCCNLRSFIFWAFIYRCFQWSIMVTKSFQRANRNANV